jgi:enoyl-CoA hydratase/carnithine racemase
MVDVEPLLEDRTDDGVVLLTLNRPERRNALGVALVTAIRAAVGRLSTDASARVIILTGAGDRAFCAGADLKERRTMDEASVASFVNDLRTMMDEVAALPQPTIAAIGGAALGGGAELALACDLRVMGETATIGLPETHLGIIPGAGGTQRLPRLIGIARAKEMIFTGRRVQAQEAAQIGLVNCTCVDPVACARAKATAILGAAPLALTAAKRAIDEGISLDLSAAMAVERRCHAVTIPTEDRVEALAAFREKRSPVFKGR